MLAFSKFLRSPRKFNSSNVLPCCSRLLRTLSTCATNVPFEEAERLVSVPLSHFQIKNLMRDEYDLSHFAMDKVISLRSSLESSNHPIVSVAQEIFEQTTSERIHSCGALVVLLIAKILQSVPSYKENTQVWDKQKVLAECYEMIDKAMYIHHEAIVNIPPSSGKDKSVDVLNNGNKLSVLGGDYLFSYGIIRLASLVKKASVFDFVGAAIDDYCISQFSCSLEDRRGNPFPWKGISLTDWEQLGGYCSTNLLAYSCQYVAILANLSSIRFEKAAYELGRNLRLKWNIEEDMRVIMNEDSEEFRPLSAPVVLHIQKHPRYFDEINKLLLSDNNNVRKLKEIILESQTIKECKHLLNTYSNLALKAASLLPDNQERQSLQSIINSA